MKILIKYIYLALISALMLFASTSCKKEPSKTDGHEVVSTEQSMKIIQLVQAFNQKKSSNLKEGYSLSVDSTIWYLETVLNVNYARIETERRDLATDSAFISIPLENDGKVSVRSVYAAYDQLLDSLSAFYYSISGEKSVIVNDVFQVSLTGSQLIVGMNMILANIPTAPNQISVWFDASDNWIWGRHLGKCDNTLQPRDASTELTTHANYSIPLAPPGQNYIYYNVEMTGVIYPGYVMLPSGQTNPFGYFNSYLFRYSPSVYSDPCLTYDAMNYYLEGIFTISDIYRPQGKTEIHYECWSDFSVSGGVVLTHFARITYGTRVIVYYPPMNPPSDE